MFFPTPQCNLNAESGEPEDEMTPEAVEFCRRAGSDATRVSELAGGRDRAVNAAIQEGIDRVNQRAASNAQRVQKWTILGRDFSITSGELGKCAGLFSPARAESRLNGRNFSPHRSDDEAEEAVGGKDVQRGNRGVLQRSGHPFEPRRASPVDATHVPL